MVVMRLIATQKLTYGTRHFEVGQEFDATFNDSKILIALKRAKDPNVRVPGAIEPPDPALAAKIAETFSDASEVAPDEAAPVEAPTAEERKPRNAKR
jgi:hypothetical protein